MTSSSSAPPPSSGPFLAPSEAARRLGVSIKALRLWEQRGLVAPVRTAAGWRAYGTAEMARATEVAALRGLGLGLAEIARVQGGDAGALEPALAQHQASLEVRGLELAGTVAKVRALRADLARGKAPAAGELVRLLRPAAETAVAFDLPWPWGGERFELGELRALTWIVGPLGSGKTRLAMRIAEALPDAAFLGLDRAAGDGAAGGARLDADPALKARVAQAMAWLAEEGALPSAALTALLVWLEAETPAALVIDLVEQGLDQATQEALSAYLRRRASRERPLFLMTRSTSILDLADRGPDAAILFCPANHSPPTFVSPYPGAAGYEAVATCLAPPDVRARTEGVVALRPAKASS